MSVRLQIMCAWAGPLFILLLVPIWINMGFMPPLSPTLTPVEVADFYQENILAIRFGATMIMQLTMLGVLWSAAVSLQLRRIEPSAAPIAAYANLALGALGFLFFVIPAIFWTVAAYRPDADPNLIALMNDAAWLSLVMPVMSATLQSLVIGATILSDKQTTPIYPRWAGYFNLWVAVTFLPGGAATFFKSGPFAWNGIFDFWLPLSTFSLWIFIMGYLTSAAVRRQARESGN